MVNRFIILFFLISVNVYGQKSLVFTTLNMGIQKQKEKRDTKLTNHFIQKFPSCEHLTNSQTTCQISRHSNPMDNSLKPILDPYIKQLQKEQFKQVFSDKVRESVQDNLAQFEYLKACINAVEMQFCEISGVSIRRSYLLQSLKNQVKKRFPLVKKNLALIKATRSSSRINRIKIKEGSAATALKSVKITTSKHYLKNKKIQHPKQLEFTQKLSSLSNLEFKDAKFEVDKKLWAQILQSRLPEDLETSLPSIELMPLTSTQKIEIFYDQLEKEIKPIGLNAKSFEMIHKNLNNMIKNINDEAKKDYLSAISDFPLVGYISELQAHKDAPTVQQLSDAIDAITNQIKKGEQELGEKPQVIKNLSGNLLLYPHIVTNILNQSPSQCTAARGIYQEHANKELLKKSLYIGGAVVSGIGCAIAFWVPPGQVACIAAGSISAAVSASNWLNHISATNIAQAQFAGNLNIEDNLKINNHSPLSAQEVLRIRDEQKQAGQKAINDVALVSLAGISFAGKNIDFAAKIKSPTILKGTQYIDDVADSTRLAIGTLSKTRLALSAVTFSSRAVETVAENISSQFKKEDELEKNE